MTYDDTPEIEAVGMTQEIPAIRPSKRHDTAYKGHRAIFVGEPDAGKNTLLNKIVQGRATPIESELVVSAHVSSPADMGLTHSPLRASHDMDVVGVEVSVRCGTETTSTTTQVVMLAGETIAQPSCAKHIEPLCRTLGSSDAPSSIFLIVDLTRPIAEQLASGMTFLRRVPFANRGEALAGVVFTKVDGIPGIDAELQLLASSSAGSDGTRLVAQERVQYAVAAPAKVVERFLVRQKFNMPPVLSTALVRVGSPRSADMGDDPVALLVGGQDVVAAIVRHQSKLASGVRLTPEDEAFLADGDRAAQQAVVETADEVDDGVDRCVPLPLHRDLGVRRGIVAGAIAAGVMVLALAALSSASTPKHTSAPSAAGTASAETRAR